MLRKYHQHFQQVAQLMTTIPTLVSSIFSGLFINIDTLPPYLSWLPYVALGRYPMMIWSTNEMADLTFFGTQNETLYYPNGTSYWVVSTYNITGRTKLQEQNISADPSSIWINEGILIGVTFVMFALSFIQLTLLKKRK